MMLNELTGQRSLAAQGPCHSTGQDNIILKMMHSRTAHAHTPVPTETHSVLLHTHTHFVTHFPQLKVSSLFFGGTWLRV